MSEPGGRGRRVRVSGGGHVCTAPRRDEVCGVNGTTAGRGVVCRRIGTRPGRIVTAGSALDDADGAIVVWTGVPAGRSLAAPDDRAVGDLPGVRRRRGRARG